MDRKAHTLAPNRAITKPQYMIFFDTETVPERQKGAMTRQRFRLGVAHFWRLRRDGSPDNHEWLEFTDIGAFWDWALHRAVNHNVLYMIAHNLAFDAQVLRTFLELPGRGWRLMFFCENGKTRMIRWGTPTKEFAVWIASGQRLSEYTGSRWSKTIMMMDNCNLFAGSIELWGSQLGFPKLHMPPYNHDDSEWWPYCKRDVEIMVKLWSEWFPFLDAQGLGTFRVTLASQAFGGFRHAYMHNKIEIHTNEPAIQLERDAYLGGRTEAFWVGRMSGADLYKLDVNSMYPFVMFEKWYPARLYKTGSGMSIPDMETTLKRFGVIARVKLDIDQPVFPVKQDNKNVYPVGQFTTALCTPEIVYALNRGWVREIGEFCTYRMRRIFYWYVKHFYGLKQEYGAKGDRLRRGLVKLLLNSLYGKFGQAGYEDRLIGTCDPQVLEVSILYEHDTHRRGTLYRVGGSVIEQYRSGEGYNSFVAIPAHVTAYARLYLWSLIERAGVGHCFYCDTDSLIVDKAGYDGLSGGLDSERLGFLKLEETANILEIRAPKDYTFGTHVVTKGRPLTASLLDKDSFTMETWPSIKSHLADGTPDTFYNREVKKTLTYSVDWGELQPNGWVKPYCHGITPLQF